MFWWFPQVYRSWATVCPVVDWIMLVECLIVWMSWSTDWTIPVLHLCIRLRSLINLRRSSSNSNSSNRKIQSSNKTSELNEYLDCKFSRTIMTCVQQRKLIIERSVIFNMIGSHLNLQKLKAKSNSIKESLSVHWSVLSAEHSQCLCNSLGTTTFLEMTVLDLLKQPLSSSQPRCQLREHAQLHWPEVCIFVDLILITFQIL